MKILYILIVGSFSLSAMHSAHEDRWTRLLSELVLQHSEHLEAFGVAPGTAQHFSDYATSGSDFNGLLLMDQSNVIFYQSHTPEQKQRIGFVAIAAKFLSQIHFSDLPNLQSLVIDCAEEDVVLTSIGSFQQLNSLTIKGEKQFCLTGEYRNADCKQLQARLRLLQAVAVDHEDLDHARENEPDANFTTNDEAREWCKAVRKDIQFSH